MKFRNWLLELRDKPGYRSEVKRNGLAGPGPFVASAREEILSSLLAMEQKLGFQLVGDEELHYIQYEWTRDFDFTGKRVGEIAEQCGRRLDMPNTPRDNANLEDDLLEAAALDAGVNAELMRQLLDIRRRKYPTLEKYGAKGGFERAIGDLIRQAAQQAENAVSDDS